MKKRFFSRKTGLKEFPYCVDSKDGHEHTLHKNLASAKQRIKELIKNNE